MSKLKNKVAVITGGNSGIGRAIAETFANEGAHVVISGRNNATLQTAAEAIGNGTLTVQADVTNLTDLDDLFEAVRERYGRIDVLVVNAGGGAVRPLEAADEAHFDSVSDVNFKGAFFTVQKALPLLADGAAILFTTSIANVRGFAGMSVYAATKAAVRSLARTFAAELAPRGIRVNALSPGPVDTPIFDRLGLSEEQTAEAKSSFVSQIPLGRIGTADEMARAALFLVSDDASFVTGAELAADGGLAQV